MSGGRFNYDQYRILEIADKIQGFIDRQGKEKDYFERQFGEPTYEVFSKDVNGIFNDGVKLLKMAYIYVQRIDWFLSGDDGEDDLIRRLYEETSEIE